VVLRFGTDGVRGEAFTELTVDDVVALGQAAAAVIGGGRWVIGRDTRASGPVFEQALARGLQAGGCTVEIAGVLPTPAIAAIGSAEGIPTAVVTASHNPHSDNGIKLFGPGGKKLTDEVEARIEVARSRPSTLPIGALGVDHDGWRPDPRRDLVGWYVDHLVAGFRDGCLAGLRMVLDCANGAMSTAAPQAARRLGAEVDVINAEPDGRNINAECGATAPASLAAAVVATGSDLGLAFDGDGDRVIAVDHLGHIVDGDRLLALGALQLRDAGQLIDDTVVVTVMSNLGFRRAMERERIAVVETPVGDRSVLAALDAGGFALGGEQSGHIIYRQLATTGDGLLAGLRLADDVRSRGVSLAELARGVMTSSPQVLVNIAVNTAGSDIEATVADAVATAQGILGDEGRVLIRASGTEPLVRVMVEAPTPELATSIADQLADVVRTRLGAG